MLWSFFREKKVCWQRWLPPPVTLVWLVAIACVAVIVASSRRSCARPVFDAVFVWCLDPLDWLRWDWPRFAEGEVWRLLSLFYFGNHIVSFSMLLRLYVIYSISSRMEAVAGSSLAFAAQFALCAGGVLTAASILESQAASSALITAIRCLWCAARPEVDVAMYNAVTVPAKFLPLAFFVLGYALGDDMKSELLGIGVGYVVHTHLIFFPALRGSTYLPGDLIQLAGLRSRPDLADKRGVVQASLRNGRLKVILDGHHVSVQADNLRRVEQQNDQPPPP